VESGSGLAMIVSSARARRRRFGGPGAGALGVNDASRGRLDRQREIVARAANRRSRAEGAFPASTSEPDTKVRARTPAGGLPPFGPLPRVPWWDSHVVSSLPDKLPAAVITLVVASLVAAGHADAKYRVGVGEYSPAMFSSPAWQSLKLKLVRYVVPWDWATTGQQAEVEAFMTAARARGQDVLVTFTAHRGCFDGRRYSPSSVCRAPSASAYRTSVRTFDDRYPWVRSYSAWNEVNHISQPTFGSPRLAVRYYRVLRSESRRRDFRVVAADVLDTSNMHRYLRSFLRRAPGRPRLWGLHNYQDVNHRTSADTRSMLETVPGEVWLTETNGIVKFGNSRQFRYSESRAARCTRWMFRLANRYDSRRRGMRSKITRLFVYRWFGAPRGARFDAGLADPDGTPRPAYFVLRRYVHSHH